MGFDQKSFLGIKCKKLLEVYFKFLIVSNSTDLWYNEGILFFFPYIYQLWNIEHYMFP